MEKKDINLKYFIRTSGHGNFGDELSPFIVKNLISDKYNLLENTESDINLFAIGSYLQYAKNDYHIWGTGVRTDPPIETNHDYTTLNVHAVRGPLTYDFLTKKGITVPQIFGDPGLLCKNFLHVDKIPKLNDKIGIVPHFSNIDKYNINSVNYTIISPLEPFKDVVKKIASCKYILSNSLHGLIIADAYNVPNVWLNDHQLHEGTLKFRDYLESQSRPYEFANSVQDFEKSSLIYYGGNKINLDYLISVFPFK